MKEYYDEYWDKEKIGTDSIYLSWKRDILMGLFANESGKKVFDIGCGNGFMLDPFCKNNSTYGVDISESAVNLAKKKGISAEVCDLNLGKLPFSDKKFDIIFCLDVLEHIFDPQSVVNDIFDFLSDDGKFVVCVPNILNIANRIRFVLGDFVDYMDVSHKNDNEFFSEHIRLFSKNKLEKLLSESGFKVEKKFFYFPKKMQDWTRLQIFGSILRILKLHKIFPTFFSLGFLYICNKK